MPLSQLKQIYRDYENALAQAHKKSSIFAGLFGQGSFDDPRSAPCNRAFYEKTGAWVAAFAASQPDKESAFEACCFLLEAAKQNEKQRTYWYYLVSQGYAKLLIPLLDTQQRCHLAQLYEKMYPRRQRLKLQEEIYQMLQAPE